MLDAAGAADSDEILGQDGGFAVGPKITEPLTWGSDLSEPEIPQAKMSTAPWGCVQD